MMHADWAKGPLTLYQAIQRPFGYWIEDADGKEVHSEDACSSSSDWKTVNDMLTAKGIKDGTCGQTQDEWIQGIENQRKKLMFLAETDSIILKDDPHG